jgi:hypothetical protein
MVGQSVGFGDPGSEASLDNIFHRLTNDEVAFA